jgi:hypothetical protein
MELGDYFYLLLKEGVRVIVCLSEPKNKMKYVEPKYWEDKIYKTTDGRFSILVEKCEESTIRSAYGSTGLEFICIRKLSISVIPKNVEEMALAQTYTVHHLHYRNWLDGCSPFQLAMYLRFLEVVDEHIQGEKNAPIAVHCSAGWGRTGCFIWCHSLFKNHNEFQKLDASQCILIMWRKLLLQRELIQNPFQLAFCCAWTQACLLGQERKTALEANTQDGSSSPIQDSDSIFSSDILIKKDFLVDLIEMGARWLCTNEPPEDWKPTIKENWSQWFGNECTNSYHQYLWKEQISGVLSKEETNILLQIPLHQLDHVQLQDLLITQEQEERFQMLHRMKPKEDEQQQLLDQSSTEPMEL